MTKIELKSGPRTFRFDCERIEQGIAINPVLPKNFDCTDNRERSARQLAWWNVAYIVEDKPGSDGTSCTLYCLNGGAWDRPTWCGSFPTLAIALEEVPNTTKDYGEAARTRSRRLAAQPEAGSAA